MRRRPVPTPPDGEPRFRSHLPDPDRGRMPRIEDIIRRHFGDLADQLQRQPDRPPRRGRPDQDETDDVEVYEAPGFRIEIRRKPLRPDHDARDEDRDRPERHDAAPHEPDREESATHD